MIIQTDCTIYSRGKTTKKSIILVINITGFFYFTLMDEPLQLIHKSTNMNYFQDYEYDQHICSRMIQA